MTTTKNLKLIGKGAFSKCYLLDETTVLIKSTDPVKECMAFGWFPESPLFPVVSNSSLDGYYEMEYYPRVSSLKKSLDADQYEIYMTLRNLVSSYSVPMNKHDAYSKLYTLFETLPEELSETMIGALDALTNYGSDIGFEISPRNVAVKDGKLILLDCFYIISELNNIRKSK